MRRVLGVFSKNMVGIKLGGLYHKGKNSFTLEFAGILYIALFIYLIYQDISILMPVFNGDILKVDTSHKPLVESLSPSLTDL